MMVSPMSFVSALYEMSIDEIEKEKKEILDYNFKYENKKLSKKEYMIKPSPDTRYKVYKKYLKGLNKVLNEKKLLKEKKYSDITSIKIIEIHFDFKDRRSYKTNSIKIKKDGSIIYQSFNKDVLSKEKTCKLDVNETLKIYKETINILTRSYSDFYLMDNTSFKIQIHFGKSVIHIENDKRGYEIRNFIKTYNL